jgi:hypothetical protein
MGMGRYFIGGTKGSSGKIYLNKGNDNFAITNQTELNADASFEDTAASFDADNDGDIDLLVGSGNENRIRLIIKSLVFE